MIRSRLSDVHIPDNVSLSDLVLRRAKEYGDRIALIDGHTGEQLSYNSLLSQVRAVGSALYRRGLRKGDVVMAFAPNCIEYVVLFHAVVGQGAIMTTANPLYTPEELILQLNDSDAVYIFTQKMLLENVKKTLENYDKIREIIVPGGAPGCVEFESLTLDDGSAYPEVNIDPKTDIAVLPYSSGTTGRSKGVMITHYGLISNICQLAHPEITAFPEGGICVFVMPFFHMYGILIAMSLGVLRGGTTVILSKFKLEEYLQTIEKYKVEFLHLVPPIALLLAKHPLVDKFDLSSMNTIACGAALLDRVVIEQMYQRLPNLKSLVQGYGMTECCLSHATIPSDCKDGSVGKTLSNTWSKVIDVDTGKVLGPDEQGEICVKGPQIMKGYIKNPQATANTIDTEGWIHTGDIGYYDEDEHFYIVDRLKELIKYKGSQVPPAELEALLVKHPEIADAAVIGVPDEAAGELPRAYVVKHQGAALTEQDIEAYVKEHLHPHMWLRGGVVFISEVPKSASGKILRRVLKAQLLEEKNTSTQ